MNDFEFENNELTETEESEAFDETLEESEAVEEAKSKTPLISLIMGIASLVLYWCCCFGGSLAPIAATLAFTFGFKAKEENGGILPGAALAGMIMGGCTGGFILMSILSTILMLAFYAIYIVVFFFVILFTTLSM